MMTPAGHNEITDAQLVAYLDGELSAADLDGVAKALAHSPDARARLERLRLGGRPFRTAFGLLAQASPDVELQAMFADLVASQAHSQPLAGGDTVVPFQRRNGRGGAPFWQTAAAAAVLAFVFAGGLFAGGFFTGARQQTQGWREEAAGYVALFSKDTLAGMPSGQDARQRNLQLVAAKLGLDLSPEKIASPELSFQGTQLLQFEGKPLVQISYLYGGDEPVALCIIPSSKPAQAAAEEKRHGLNIVHWIEGGYGFMVVGNVPKPALRQISETFRARFS